MLSSVLICRCVERPQASVRSRSIDEPANTVAAEIATLAFSGRR